MAISLDELNEIDIDKLGDLPLVVQFIIIAVICVIILAGGFWFLNKPQIEELEKEQRTEQDLRTEFEGKQSKGANLQEYEDQMEQMKKTFGTLLRKLPSKTEVPGLLEDISAAGVTSGLRVDVFKPLPEQELSFYAELPIEMRVSGNFHQIAEFISKLSLLDRIVTVHDFSIVLQSSATTVASSSKTKVAASAKKIDAEGPLMMSVIVKTYRYKNDGEES